MAKRQKLEADVLRCRNQGQWDRAIELTKQISNKYGITDPVVRLVNNEAELEKFLFDHELCQANVLQAQKSLFSTNKNLIELQSVECKNSEFDVSGESALLLAKLQYVQGNLSMCLQIYSKLDLPNLVKGVTQIYQTRLYSEAFAIKGLCLEEELSKKSSSQYDEPIACYEKCIQLVISYLSDYNQLYNPSHNTAVEDSVIGPVLESALHRAPILHIKNKNIWKGINILRLILRSLHSILSPRLQQAFSCRLAAILLRGISADNYENNDIPDRRTSTIPISTYTSGEKMSDLDTSLRENYSFSTLPSQRTNSSQTKPKFFLGENDFTPQTVQQEVILLLRISEIMLNVDPILDMSPEHAVNRDETLRNAGTLYNLMCIAATALGQYSLLSSCIEKSLKYAFDHYYLWHQFALSLYSAGKANQALQSFLECCRINPDNLICALLAAKTCYEQRPPQIEEGLKLAHLAAEMTTQHSFSDDGLLSRAHLCVGVGMSLKALSSSSNKDQSKFRDDAISAYTEAHIADPYDYKPILFSALELAYSRKISLAFKKVKEALDLEPENLDCLHLLILLLTSRSQYYEAKLALQSALQMYPENTNLLATKCKLEQHMGEHDEALRSCDEIMKLWTATTDPTCVNDRGGIDGAVDRMTNDGLSTANQSFGDNLDTGSFLTGSYVASKYDQTPSDFGSSFADMQPRLAVLTSASSQAWLQVAEVYLSLNRANEAEMCIGEAVQLEPFSPTVLYMRGLLHEHRNEMNEACAMYSNALVIDPTHVKATERLASLFHLNGSFGLAKKLLQDAIKLDMQSHTIWQLLGEILENDGDLDGAIECSTFALNLESNSPVVPFTNVFPQL